MNGLIQYDEGEMTSPDLLAEIAYTFEVRILIVCPNTRSSVAMAHELTARGVDASSHVGMFDRSRCQALRVIISTPIQYFHLRWFQPALVFVVDPDRVMRPPRTPCWIFPEPRDDDFLFDTNCPLFGVVRTDRSYPPRTERLMQAWFGPKTVKVLNLGRRTLRPRVVFVEFRGDARKGTNILSDLPGRDR